MPKLLFNILNWGLGHATRSTPLIEQYIKQGYQVHIASDGVALDFLQKRFPNLTSHELPSYDITYSSGNNQVLGLAFQIPKILRVIRQEQQCIQSIHRREKFDLCISDNRFGCYLSSVHSIYITHQLVIKSPIGEGFVKKLHGKIINRFDECWIPDNPPPNNLAGNLDDDTRHLKKFKYIGLLSHLNIEEQNPEYDITYLLSGPEPHRTLLEGIILKNHPKNKKGLLIRGKQPNHSKPSNKNEQLEVLDLVESNELSEVLGKSKQVVVRSGYSSIMDLMDTHLQLCFVPTPGQTEQEYLGEVLKQKGHTVILQNALGDFLGKL